MLSTPIKALLGVLGAIGVVLVAGYATGEFDRFLSPEPTQIAAVPPAVPVTTPGQPEAQPASADPAAGQAQDAPAATPPAQVAPAGEPAKSGIVPPTFDLLRVEPDGSIVIAGRAPGGAKVEVLAGSKVIGSTTAGTDGDFAVVIEEPLKPGSYQIVLRATDAANNVAMSVETAVVSIPERPDGQVLALVEQPGQPSKLITVPEPMTSSPAQGTAQDTAPAQEKPADTASAPATPPPPAPAAGETQTAAAPTSIAPTQPATGTGDTAAGTGDTAAAPATGTGTAPATGTEAPAAPAADASTDVAAANPEPARPEVPTTAPAEPVTAMHVEVRAIEIEGNKVFVAGMATPKRPVRVYANERMLGETRSSATGEFLVEALVDLPVGDYIVRADLLADDGVKVLMRAQVPFRREAGEAIAAVAPPAPQPAAQPPAPAAQSSTAAAQPSTAPAQPPAAAPQASTPAAQPPAPAAEPKPESTAQAPVRPATAPAPVESAAAPPPSAPQVATQPQTSTQPQDAPPAAVVEAPAPAPGGTEEQVAAAQTATSQTDTAVPKPDLALPTSAPVVTSAPLQAVDGAVIIRRGDTLWRISRRVYGRGVRYSTIYLANQAQIADPDRIWPGQVFTVPEKTGAGETANMEAIGGQAVSPEDLAKYPPVR